jgi:hypothetical protein
MLTYAGRIRPPRFKTCDLATEARLMWRGLSVRKSSLSDRIGVG